MIFIPEIISLADAIPLEGNQFSIKFLLTGMETNKDSMNGRQEVIELFTEIYGKVETQDGRITRIGKYRTTQIAELLGYDTGQFSKFINPSSNKTYGEDTYKRLIKRIEITKENIILKKRSKKIAILSFLTGVVLCIFVYYAMNFFERNRTENLSNPAIEEEKKQYTDANNTEVTLLEHTPKQIVDDVAQYHAIYDEKGDKVVETMAGYLADIIRTNYKYSPSEITDEVKISAMHNIQDAIRKGLGKSRSELKRKNYVAVYKEMNVVDFLNHIIPVDSCFLLSPEEMLLDELPARATLYDEKMWYFKDKIFTTSRPDTQEELASLIGDTFKAAQHQIREEEERQFLHFKATGRFALPFGESEN